MRNIRKKKMTPMSEYIRIRQYVMSLVFAAKDDKLVIPSLKELSDSFEVSRPTVCKALRELINEGCLVGRPGIGTFINPAFVQRQKWMGAGKRIGLLLSDGLLMYYDIYYGRILSAVMEHLVDSGCQVKLHHLTFQDIESNMSAIRQENYDCILWINPPEKYGLILDEMKAIGIPVITAKDSLQDVYFNREQLGCRIGEYMLQNKLFNTIALFDEPPYNVELDAIRETFRRAGVQFNNRLCLKLNENPETEINRIYELGVQVDSILNLNYPYASLMKILGKFNIQWGKECCLIQNKLNVFDEKQVPGLYFDYDMKAFAGTIGKCITSLTGKGKRLPPQPVEMELNKYER